MNKKAIGIIIGLMTAALLGIGWMQVDLIRSSIKVNEEKFDSAVYQAINTVAERLEYEEQLEVFNYYNGYSTAYFEREIQVQEDNQSSYSYDVLIERNSGQGVSQTKMLADLVSDIFKNSCTCPDCRAERAAKVSSLMNFQELANFPLVDRINLDHLKGFIHQELNDQGIDIDYNYGVFSSGNKSFVIANDHYVVEDGQPKEILPGYQNNLYSSKYKVNLFPTKDALSPGLLMIHFPGKISFVWRTLWANLLGSILFTSIILFCFVYTIYVIFRQKKLSEMKTDFINNMTHEFKTPIATISLAADSINSPMINGNPDKVKRFAGIIKQENKRMNSQVEKVLQMALLDKEDFQLKLTDVNLHEVIGRAVENISLQVEKKEGVVQKNLLAENAYVQGDLTHISNVINNLLDNANKYSPKKPEIFVHTSNIPNGVEVIIEDKGVGMTKEARKHIFDKFYRVHTGDLHDVKGFGLGLSYVKAMVTAHKGQVEVKSELGKGSSFILFFPFRVEAKL